MKKSKSKKDIFNLVNYISYVDVITFENKNLIYIIYHEENYLL